MKTYLIRTTFEDTEPFIGVITLGDREGAEQAAEEQSVSCCSGNLIEVVEVDNKTLKAEVVFQARGLKDY